MTSGTRNVDNLNDEGKCHFHEMMWNEKEVAAMVQQKMGACGS